MSGRRTRLSRFLHVVTPPDKPELGVCPNDLELPFELCRLPEIVGVEKGDPLLLRAIDPEVARAGCATVPLAQKRGGRTKRRQRIYQLLTVGTATSTTSTSEGGEVWARTLFRLLRIVPAAL